MKWILIALVLISACAPTYSPEATTMQELYIEDGETITLTADVITKTVDGNQYKMYGYNSQIPGPIFQVKQGSSVTVHFVNNLPEPTTVHWHGLRHDNKDDGVPGVTQPTIEPGQSYTYTLRFPDEGIYWYHPHVREDRQQDLGLYGNILVTSTEDHYNPVTAEEFIVLDDLLIENGEIVPYGNKHANFALMGRFGNTLLINGDTNYVYQTTPGSVVRFYLTNIANVRPYNFSMQGLPLKLVGSDLGRYEHETLVDSVVISPAERYIIEVAFPAEGEYAIQHITPNRANELGRIIVTGAQTDTPFAPPHAYPDVTSDIQAYAAHFTREPDLTLDLTVDMMGPMMEMMEHERMGHGNMMHNGMMSTNQPIEWEDDMGPMNRMSTSATISWIIQDEIGNENMDIPLSYKVGDLVKIRLFNDPDSMHPMQHPIHLHGQRFLITHVDGQPMENKVWKDTVLVPAGSTIDLLVELTNPGTWMLHCHIAEHLEAGMMASMLVTP